MDHKCEDFAAAGDGGAGGGPLKRRKISSSTATAHTDDDTEPFTHKCSGDGGPSSLLDAKRKRDSRAAYYHHDSKADKQGNVPNPAIAKQAKQTVAQFLAKRIPDQYAPTGIASVAAGSTLASGEQQQQLAGLRKPDPNTKYCYRHQPDLKCRRQVDEPSMDELQRNLENLDQGDKQAIAHVWSIFSAATAKERKLLLQGILAQCCFSQLSYLSHSVQDMIRIDFMSILPAEICFRILCFLDTASLCKAAQVSRTWRMLADDDVVWHRMCEQHIHRKCTKCGWGLPMLEQKRLRASKRQIQLRAAAKGHENLSGDLTAAPEGPSPVKADDQVAKAGPSDTTAPSSQNTLTSLTTKDKQSQSKSSTRRPWKDVYRDRFRVGTNWKYGRCDIKIFRGHQNGVMCLQFDDSILATGSYDTTVKIWDIATGEELRTLRGHTSAVRCLQFDDTKLISGGLDSKIKIWNWRTGECLSTLNATNSGGVIGLHYDSNILVTGSADGTLRIWNFDDKSTTVLRGHSDWINSVKIDSQSRTVFSASDDGTVKIWDLDSKTCIKKLEGHAGLVQQVILLPHDVEFDLDNDHHDRSASHRRHHHHTHGGDDQQQPSPRAVSPASSNHSFASSTTGTAGTNSHHTASSPSFVHDHASAAAAAAAAAAPALHPFGPNYSHPTTDDTPAATTRPLPPRYCLTSALDSTIRLWDTYTGKAIQTYFGHVEGVWAVAADNLRMVSGAQDRTVKVWDIWDGKCEKTFGGPGGHTGPVTCIGLSDSRMCSGSEDCEVRMYSF